MNDIFRYGHGETYLVAVMLYAVVVSILFFFPIFLSLFNRSMWLRIIVGVLGSVVILFGLEGIAVVFIVSGVNATKGQNLLITLLAQCLFIFIICLDIFLISKYKNFLDQKDAIIRNNEYRFYRYLST